MVFSPEEMNILLDRRIRDLAARRPAENMQDHLQRVREDRPRLMRCLGLEPLPPKTDLAVCVTGTIERVGYRIEKIAYLSRPNFPVTAHLYLPVAQDPVPVILRPHGHWPGKKAEPVVQASAISLVLAGYAVFVIDSPGQSWEPEELNERGEQGSHDDAWLSMGAPLQGFYVWDIMRGIDYLEKRPEADASKIGITGASGGGTVAMYAFAADERIQCCAPVCSAASMEIAPNNGCLCNHVPGVMALGDRSDLLALRVPAPVLLVGATDDPEFPPDGLRKTFEKLTSIYKRFDAARQVRLEVVEAKHDYNRRMREAVLAFFDQHLKQRLPRSYVGEARPITDGVHNPYPAETVDREDPSLQVLPRERRGDLTLRRVLEKVLEEAGTTPFDATERLAPWAKYDRLRPDLKGEVLDMKDLDLNLSQFDQRTCIYLGIGLCEFYAQVLHVMLPGGLEGWEKSAVGAGGDFVSSLIGSMKSLVDSSSNPMHLKEIRADGPAASLIAQFLALYRPELTIFKTHIWSSWQDIYEFSDPVLIQPQAKYLECPFSGVKTSPTI